MKRSGIWVLLSCLLACCLLLPPGGGAAAEASGGTAGGGTAVGGDQAQLEQIFGILEGRHQDPSTVEEYVRLATMAYARGAYDQALSYLDQCIALVGSEDAVSLGMLWTEKGTVYQKMERLADAAQALETAAAYTPYHPAMLSRQAQVYLALEQYADAARALETYLALIPEDAEAWGLLAQAYEDSGRSGKSGQAREQAEALAQDEGNLLLSQARTQALLGGYEAAEAAYTSYLEGAEDAGGKVHFLRGTVRMQRGDIEGAIADLEAALTLSHPEPAVCYEYLNNCWYLLNDHQKALETGERALALGGEAPAWDALYLRMGISALGLGRPEVALRYLDEAGARNDALAGVHYYRALAHMALSDFEAAIGDLDASIQREELAQQCLYNRGLCRIQLEDLPAAIGDFEQALTLGEDEIVSKAAEDMLWQIALQYMAEIE